MASEEEKSRPSYSRSSSYNSTTTSTSTEGGGLLVDGLDINPRSGMPLAELLETWWEPHADLTARRLKGFSSDIKRLAKTRRDEILRGIRADAGRQGSENEKEALKKAMEKEVLKMRKKVADRVDKLSERWQDAKAVRLRDKISFVIGIMNLVASSLIFAFQPQWVPYVYAGQLCYFMPLRIYTYRARAWSYFLLDFCYYQQILNLLYILVFPENEILFSICFCAAHGPLAFSVATWRNSYVPHSIDKMCSLFIHIYPPFVFMTIRHFMPLEIMATRWKGAQPETLPAWTAFGLNVAAYAIWQVAYYELISVPKAQKLASGQRINSYTTMTKGKGAVAGLISKAPPAQRETAFMVLQFAYTILTTCLSPLLFYPSARASAIFLIGVLTIAVWNGASYYIEVWGRRFERELIALRSEIEAAQSAESIAHLDGESGASGPNSTAASRRNSTAMNNDESDSKGDTDAAVLMHADDLAAKKGQ